MQSDLVDHPITGTPDDRDIFALGVAAEFGGGFQAGITFQDWDFDTEEDVTHTGIGLGYESGPIAVHANWGEYNFDTSADVAGWGVAGAYDLGGGLKVHAAYADSDALDAETWSLGLSMAF